MQLTEEIKLAAQLLGESLKTYPGVQAYLDLKIQSEADPQIAALEQRLETLYKDLAAREQAGESLASLAADEYFDLRKKVRYHPVLSERDGQLNVVKNVFTQTSSEISAILGVDFTTLALSTPEDV